MTNKQQDRKLIKVMREGLRKARGQAAAESFAGNIAAERYWDGERTAYFKMWQAAISDTPKPEPAPEECDILAAMKTLGIDGDTLFSRISDDLARGATTSARSHLDFVDRMRGLKGVLCSIGEASDQGKKGDA